MSIFPLMPGTEPNNKIQPNRAESEEVVRIS
jgi:hypothetical protein